MYVRRLKIICMTFIVSLYFANFAQADQICPVDLEENITSLNDQAALNVLRSFRESLQPKHQISVIGTHAFQKSPHTLFITYAVPTAISEGYLKAEVVLNPSQHGFPKAIFTKKISIESNMSFAFEELKESLPRCADFAYAN